MNWYYAIAGDQKGPVSESEFQRLVNQGTVTAQTLVWREGMAGWQPFESFRSPTVPTDNVTCGTCGRAFPATEVIAIGGQLCCAGCKPALVQRMKEGVSVNAPAEEIRTQHLKHEASIKSIGILYYMAAIGCAVAAGVQIFAISAKGNFAVAAGTATFTIIFAIASVIVGYGVRRLRKWSRIPVAILSGLGLLGFPFGTIINAYILYLVLSRKGATVFSDEYQSVIEQTPNIKYRTSILVWILLALLLLGLGAAVVIPFFARR